MARWCVYSPEGTPLPEPIGDTAEEAIEAFCALSEFSRQYFDEFGYTVGPVPVIH